MDPSNFLSTPANYATPGQQAQAQQLAQLATPQQIQAMYDYAKALRTSSTDTPVHAWTQGVSNVVKALMGGVEENRAANAERGVMGAQANAIPGGDGASAPGDLPGFGTIDSNRPRVSGGDQPSDTALANAESGGDDNAKNPLSSATGRYQFTDGTWKDVMQRHPDLGLTPDGRTDPAQQEKAKAAYDSDNAKVLSTAGYQPDQGNLRLAMRFGANGATKVLGADPGAPMGSIEPPNVMAINPDLGNATAGGIRQRYASLGAPNLPPDAQAMTKALNPNVQVAQNGPMPGGMSQQGFDPQGMINQMARRLIMTGIPPQQALATATEYVGNNLKLMPQYTTDPYGREMMVQPGHPPQLTGRQLGPGQSGTFMGLPTETTLGPNAEPHMRVITPESGAPSGAAPGPQGAAPAPGNVGTAEPQGAPPAPVAANATPPSATPPVTVAGPLPQGTQVPQPPPEPGAQPSTSAANTMPPMPTGSHVSADDWIQWQTDTAAAKAAAVKSAESLAEATAKGRVKPIDDAVEIGTKAGPIMNDLDTLKDAYAAAGNNINGGPFASTIIQMKQGINEMLPGTGLVDQDKLNASQIIQKINMGLATKMVKELTSRGTQMEIMLAMKNNPGVMMSDKGSLYMIDLLHQMQEQNQQLGILASQKGYDNPREWNAMQRAYYDSHPLISPFTGKPLNSQTALNADIAQLPAASTPTANQGPPGFNVPPVAVPPEVKSPNDMDAFVKKMGLKSGTSITLPDGSIGKVP
jgi:hypothetical protein